MVKLTVTLKVSVLMMLTAGLVACSEGNDDSDADEYPDNGDDQGGDSEEAETVQTYTIDVAVVVGDGVVDIQPDQNEYEEGQMVTVSAVADSGWEFERWDGDFEAQTEPTVNVEMEQDLTIEAYFIQMER